MVSKNKKEEEGTRQGQGGRGKERRRSGEEEEGKRAGERKTQLGKYLKEARDEKWKSRKEYRGMEKQRERK